MERALTHVLEYTRIAFLLLLATGSQGLCYDGGFLYESTGLFGGKSSVRKVDPETGKVLQSVSLDDKHFGEGMVILGNEVMSE